MTVEFDDAKLVVPVLSRKLMKPYETSPGTELVGPEPPTESWTVQLENCGPCSAPVAGPPGCRRRIDVIARSHGAGRSDQHVCRRRLEHVGIASSAKQRVWPTLLLPGAARLLPKPAPEPNPTLLSSICRLRIDMFRPFGP